DFAFDRRTPDVQTVVSLVPSSAAAAAGLRNGDVVTTPVAAEQLVSDTLQQMKLDVVRSGELLYVTYITRPMFNESWQWPGVPGGWVAACRGAQPSITDPPITHQRPKKRATPKRRARGSP